MEIKLGKIKVEPQDIASGNHENPLSVRLHRH